MGDGASFYDGIGITEPNSSRRSIQIAGNPSLECKATQTVNVYLLGTQTFVLSGWAKGNSVPDNLQVSDYAVTDTYKQFGLRAVLTYTDNTINYFYYPFNPAVKEWQYGSLTSVSSTGQADTSRTYVGGDLMEVFTGGNGNYQFSYDSAHRVTLTPKRIAEMHLLSGLENIEINTIR